MGHTDVCGAFRYGGAPKHMGGIQTGGSSKHIGHPNIWGHPNILGASKYMGVSKHIHTIHIYQNNLINFVEIKFSSKIHVDTMKVEDSQSVNVCGCPNNILRYATATLTSQCSLV